MARSFFRDSANQFVACVYCGHRKANSYDHVIPRSKGGGKGSNLVPACRRCQSQKGDMMPDEYFATYPDAYKNFQQRFAGAENYLSRIVTIARLCRIAAVPPTRRGAP